MKTVFLLITLVLCGVQTSCTIGRNYKGAPLKVETLNSIQKGVTTKGEILSRFGAPGRIMNQTDGDIFIYEYQQENFTEIELSSPLVVVGGNVTFFTYTKNDSKADSLVILFDRNGVVISFGYTNETSKLRLL